MNTQKKPQSLLTKSSIKTIKQSNNLSNSNIKQVQTKMRKKLSKIQSLDEVIKIHKMIKSQNQQLSSDVRILNQHLSKVQQNKKEKNKQKLNIINQSKTKNNNNQGLSSSLVQSKLSIKNVGVAISQQQLNKYPSQLVSQYQNLRKQLKEQYKLMGLLKNNILSIKKQSTTTQQVSDQIEDRKNRLVEIQQQIEKQNKAKNVLLKQNIKLQQTVNKEIHPANINHQQIIKLQSENKQLRKQILLSKQQTHKHQLTAAKVIDSIYNKKQQLQTININNTKHNSNDEKGNNQIDNNKKKLRSRSVVNIRSIVDGRNSSNNNKGVGNKKILGNNQNKIVINNKYASIVGVMSNYNAHDIIETTQSQHNTIINDKNIIINTQPTQIDTESQQQHQITSLKQQINQLSLAQIKTKQILKKQKQTLKQNNFRLNQNLILLDKNKTKKISEFNHLKAKIKHIMKQLQQHHTNKIKMVNISTQQQQYHHINNTNINNNNIHQQLLSQLPLRRDFAGVIGSKFRFDDRLFLRQKTKSFIKGLIVYQNDNNNLAIKGSIAAIRAIYTDQQTNLMNFVPIPGVYLQKCKQQRLQLPQDDFLKLIKVKYNTKQTRVIKIQIRSNRNLKYQFGEKRAFQQVGQNEIVYAFDIGLEEFPSCLFGSLCHVRNCWYLESVGVEIGLLG